MSESNIPENVQIVPVAANPATDQVTALDINRRHQRENEIAAVEVLSHRRRKKLEELVKSRSETLTALQKRASQFGDNITEYVKAHVLKVDLTAFNNVATAMNTLKIGKFAAGVTAAARNDKEEQVTFTTRLVCLDPKTSEEELEEIKSTGEIEIGYRYHNSSPSHTPIGEEVKVVVDFYDIANLVTHRDVLADTNKQIKNVQDELDQLNGELVTLPQFQQELKVHLAERQLAETSEGQDILSAINDQAYAGFENLLALPEAKS